MLETDIAGIKLKNPVIAASGTFGLEYRDLVDFSGFGAIIPKTVTYRPKTGNKPPRTCETAAGLLNSIGLENKGVERFLEEDLPQYLAAGATVVASLGGEAVDEYVEAARVLDDSEGISGIELNISCPNVDKGGLQFGCRPRQAAEVTTAVRQACGKPLIVKLTPNVTNITEIARACEAAGADGLSLINTIRGMAIDVENARPVLGKETGGLSGPAIKPVALRMVYETADVVHIPVIGCGGIMDAEDALEFLMAGAAAVEIGTASFIDPRTGVRVARGIMSFLRDHGYDRIGQIIGKARRHEG